MEDNISSLRVRLTFNICLVLFYKKNFVKKKTNDKTKFQEYHKDARNNFKQEITKLQEENKSEIKNKEDELKSLQDNITNLNQNIETLQLKYDKEVGERQRLSNELTKINNESKLQISEKSSLERQVS